MYNFNHIFNLRTKLIIGFAAFLVVATLINLMFLKDFDSFQTNVRMFEHASNISNVCLEIRRYEKNFAINKSLSDYQTTLEFVNQIIDYINTIKDGINAKDRNILERQKEMIKQYKIYFTDLKDMCIGAKTLADCNYTESVQSQGAKMVTLAEGLAKDSLIEVESFAKGSKIKLTLYFSFLIVFSLCGMIVFFITIGQRLKTLESAANAIATGDYKSLPESKLNDEVQIVFKAFDRMVEVLEERQELLFQAEKLSSIGTLASGMAHQLNNPLNNIATSCQLALEEAKDIENTEFITKLLHTVSAETRRAAEIVRELLEFSRRDMFTQKPVSLNKLMSTVVNLVHSDVPTGIQILQEIPPDITVHIDEQKMKEVFINLIINSIQAMKDETGTITIAAELDTASDSIIITVSDTGIGIEEQYIQQIFDPFYTTKDIEKGTGLGLAVVYGIIKKHKGSITARNNEEKGATFTITLPRA
jgi:signal transduction histidine kinase